MSKSRTRRLAPGLVAFALLAAPAMASAEDWRSLDFGTAAIPFRMEVDVDSVMSEAIKAQYVPEAGAFRSARVKFIPGDGRSDEIVKYYVSCTAPFLAMDKGRSAAAELSWSWVNKNYQPHFAAMIERICR